MEESLGNSILVDSILVELELATVGLDKRG